MNSCLYIDYPPSTIKCWYCQEDCGGMRSFDHVEYACYRHEQMVVSVSCVRHSVEGPNWFFNRIKIEHEDSLRFHWNYYSGFEVELEHQERTNSHVLVWNGTDWAPTNINQFSGWMTVKRYPAQMLSENSIEKIGRFFKLYKVWS